MMRQIILDTETTGFDPLKGDKLVEIGAVELINRRLTGNNYHQYIQPQRQVPADAFKVHGISNEFLLDKPIFSSICDDFMRYIEGAELIIHNAPFDIGFINAELQQLKPNKWGKVEDTCQVTDSLKMARKAFPGQRATLDALAKRYNITAFNRDLHGALLDSEILAQVYLQLTGGQTDLLLHESLESNNIQALHSLQNKVSLKILKASPEEMELHKLKLQKISKKSNTNLDW